MEPPVKDMANVLRFSQTNIFSTGLGVAIDYKVFQEVFRSCQETFADLSIYRGYFVKEYPTKYFNGVQLRRDHLIVLAKVA